MADIKFLRAYVDTNRDVPEPANQPGLFTILEFENLDPKSIADGYAKIMKFNLWSFLKEGGFKFMLDHGITQEEADSIIARSKVI